MPAVNFHLRPSRQYLIIFGMIVLASVLILIGLPIPLWLKLIAIAIVLVHGFRVCWRYALLRDKLSITIIRYVDEGRWVIQTREGTFAAQLQSNSTVTSIIILLHFKIAGKMLPLKSIIFRDSLSADDFRQLLVILNN